MQSLFPYEEVRDQQDQLLAAVQKAVEAGGELVAHAPTGLGKTAAALAPAISYGLANKKAVVFLTSRHTQHTLALDTIKQIRQKHNVNIKVSDLIGKKHYCLQPGAVRLRSREFSEYCRALKEDKQCEYFENLKQGENISTKAKLALKELQADVYTSEHVKTTSERCVVCPYEIAMLMAKEADVIITDYNYLFNPGIATNFLQKIGRELKDIIIIVDEAHNLPDRVKEAASDTVTTIALQRAANEAEKYKYDEQKTVMEKLAEILQRFGLTIDHGMDERFLEKEDFARRIRELGEIQELIETLETIGDAVREEQQYSYLGAVGAFLRTWFEGEDDGFARILSENTFRDETVYTLSYRCLDPSVITGPVVTNAYATVMMSGTLSPTRMYKELLGALKAEELVLKSPFPAENRLNIILPKTSTKFTQRSEGMYEEIAVHCTKIANAIPGNSAIFFPSYALLQSVQRYFDRQVQKTVFAERPGMSKEEKVDFLNRFKQYKDHGAVLMGVISGNFGEGVDLPGNLLKGVVVVGLPLGKPDLETKALIKYFDNKFGRGWEYGYTFPAFNKTLQSAGRCIRTETDRGVIVFLDERYEHERYKNCFPTDWDMKTTLLYENMIKNFFSIEKHDARLSEFQ